MTTSRQPRNPTRPMSESQQQLSSEATDEPKTLAETALGSFDMSVGSVPEDWVQAEEESPIGDDATWTNKSARFGKIPTGRQSTFQQNIAATAASFIMGSLWYVTSVLELYSGPWIAAAMGAVIGLAVRLASPGGPPSRAAVSVAGYLITLLVVLILVSHRELSVLYGGVDQFQSYEQTLVRTRLQDPLHLAAYGLGGFLAFVIPYGVRLRR